MLYILFLLASLTIGSGLWTVIQILKPSWFFKAESEANLKRKRPGWYLAGGIVGILAIFYLWVQALQLMLTPVWILTAVMTLGSVKPLAMVFFYDKFSGQVTALVTQMERSKILYWSIVALRGLLTLVLLAATWYFLSLFGYRP